MHLVEVDGIEYIEIYFKGEKIGEADGGTISQKVSSPGWYTLKTETAKGKLRYCWLKIESLTGNLKRPAINVTSGTYGSSDWYRSNVTVTVNTNESDVTKVYYKLQNASSIGEGEGEFISVERK